MRAYLVIFNCQNVVNSLGLLMQKNKATHYE